MSSSVASWHAYRFLRRQVRWSGTPTFFRNFPRFVVNYTVKALTWSIVRESLTGAFLRAVSHESFVPLQAEQHAAPRDWGHCVRQTWVSFSKHFLYDKLFSLTPLSWDMDCLLTSWLTSPLVPLVTIAVRLVFWSLSFPKEVSCTQPIYIQRKIIKAPLLHQNFSPHVFFVSLSLSFSGWFSGAWRPVVLTFLPELLRPSREGTLCLHPLERAPGAFMSDASPMSRALLVLCINQGISASFSLLLSYRWLHTTRFWSIKGSQQSMKQK